MKAKDAYLNFITCYDPYYQDNEPEYTTEEMIYNLKEIKKDLEENEETELITMLDNALALLERTSK